ncbi:MAG TPA: HEAT repeat domain-containing protein [Allosphingosinicella sp.]|nr:HEAT repeat domain-containing protein [Allosphingosinicella sp.]
MIAGNELADWLRDRQAQRNTGETMEEVARRLRHLPCLERLHDGLDLARSKGVEAVLALAETFVATPGVISEVLGVLIAAARHDPYFRPHFDVASSEVHSGLLLFDRPALSLTLAVMSADAIAAKRAERKEGASLTFTGRRTVFHFLKSGGATLSLWEAPEIGPGFTADSSGRCRFVERWRIEDGEKLDLDGRRFTFIVEEAERDLVFVGAETSLGAGPLSVEYDSATLRFIGASSTDEASSRTQMMLALLRMMDRRDAIPLFEEMLRSEHFYARWQTMREFLALDPGAAFSHLREMAESDSHSEVRRVAAQTLARLFEKELVPCPC